ncbi:MAG TPA: hypothetical protein VFI25_17675 [Planctomycetota bacterium]|nr:hypothetical protein [Planctomycetota bacterium]
MKGFSVWPQSGTPSGGQRRSVRQGSLPSRSALRTHQRFQTFWRPSASSAKKWLENEASAGQVRSANPAR